MDPIPCWSYNLSLLLISLGVIKNDFDGIKKASRVDIGKMNFNMN